MTTLQTASLGVNLFFAPSGSLMPKTASDQGLW